MLLLSMRPLTASSYSNDLLASWLCDLMSVPGLIQCAVQHTPHVPLLLQERVFSRLLQHARLHIDAISSTPTTTTSECTLTQNVFDLEASLLLSVAGNMIHLGILEMDGVVNQTQSFIVRFF